MPEISYIARKIETVSNGPGYWNYTLVGVYEKELSDPQESSDGRVTTTGIEKLIGQYQRNYSGPGPFYPFQKDGKWYALYSKEYMYTRVMSLPDCKDLGGEDDSNTEYKNHFCPTEYFVPELCVRDFKKDEIDPHPYVPNWNPKDWAEEYTEQGFRMWRWPHDKGYKQKEKIPLYESAQEKAKVEYEAYAERHPFITKYADFAFVSGCVWGDDTSDKIEFIDLTEADKGIIKRDARFGYIELPRNVNLKQAIDVDSDDDDCYVTWKNLKVQIALPANFNVNSGKRYKEDWSDCWDDKMREKD